MQPLDRDPLRCVAVVHGRNLPARDWLFAFLRALDLWPIEWEEGVASTHKAAPVVMEVLDQIFRHAHVAIILVTADEEAFLKFPFQHDSRDCHPQPQARPNVFLEAGLALVCQPDRTLLVRIGQHRDVSDLLGLHEIRFPSADGRVTLKNRLQTAGCPIPVSGTHWATVAEDKLQEAIALTQAQSCHSLLRSALALIDGYQSIRDAVLSNMIRTKDRKPHDSRDACTAYFAFFNVISAHDPLICPGDAWIRTLASVARDLPPDCHSMLSDVHRTVLDYHALHLRLQTQYHRHHRLRAVSNAAMDLTLAAQEVVSWSTALMARLLDARFG